MYVYVRPNHLLLCVPTTCMLATICLEDDRDRGHTGGSLSEVFIIVIGTLSAAVLLLSLTTYYYCRRMQSRASSSRSSARRTRAAAVSSPRAPSPAPPPYSGSDISRATFYDPTLPSYEQVIQDRDPTSAYQVATEQPSQQDAADSRAAHTEQPSQQIASDQSSLDPHVTGVTHPHRFGSTPGAGTQVSDASASPVLESSRDIPTGRASLHDVAVDDGKQKHFTPQYFKNAVSSFPHDACCVFVEKDVWNEYTCTTQVCIILAGCNRSAVF